MNVEDPIRVRVDPAGRLPPQLSGPGLDGTLAVVAGALAGVFGLVVLGFLGVRALVVRLGLPAATPGP